MDDCELCKPSVFLYDDGCACATDNPTDDGGCVVENCAATCQDCYAPQDDKQCGTCLTNTYKLPGTNICRSKCTTGLTIVGDKCDGPQGLVVNLEIDNKILTNWLSSVNNIEIYGGLNDSDGDDDPISVSDRGLWFDGVDDILTFDRNFSIHITNTVESWVRPIEPYGCIFSFSDASASTNAQSRYVLNAALSDDLRGVLQLNLSENGTDFGTVQADGGTYTL